MLDARQRQLWVRHWDLAATNPCQHVFCKALLEIGFDRPIFACPKQFRSLHSPCPPPQRLSQERPLPHALYIPTQNTFAWCLFPWGSCQHWYLAARSPKLRWRLAIPCCWQLWLHLRLQAEKMTQASPRTGWKAVMSIIQNMLETLFGEAGIKTVRRFLVTTRSSPNSECVVGKGWFWAGISFSHFKSKCICFPWNRQVELEQWLELTVCKERFCFILKGWNTLKYFPMEMTFCFCWCTWESSHHSFHPPLAAPTSAGGTQGVAKHTSSTDCEWWRAIQPSCPGWRRAIQVVTMKTLFLVGKMEGQAIQWDLILVCMSKL